MGSDRGLQDSPEWQRLQAHQQRLAGINLRQHFARDPQRAEHMQLEAAGVFLDYSKQCIDAQVMKDLLALAERADLLPWIQRLFAGDAVNHTEGRAAMHMALRANADVMVQGVSVGAEVQEVLKRCCGFADQLRSGDWSGHDGAAIRDVVNIGIGGSDLGPRMVVRALRDRSGPEMHFIANVDGAPLAELLEQLDPKQTLFIITSKTFTTQETMANAQAARAWLVEALGETAVARHFVAVSTNQAAVESFGIDANNMFGFWPWVGGRYSLWSAVGLSIAVAIGSVRFRELLAGAAEMDAHFSSAPLSDNLPVLMGLLAFWNRHFLRMPTQVVAPYAQALEFFPAWLQQLEMESNGKGVDREGRPLAMPATPAIWGDCGTNAQHAFFQMLHQGLERHPVDFVLPSHSDHPLQSQHQMLIANCLAQSAALAFGKNAEVVRAELRAKGMSGEALEQAIPHRCFSGNRPSNTLLIASLTPKHLGALLALYEHRTFVLSVLWQINAFDQWGVELGKQLAGDVLDSLRGQGAVDLDPSTRSLLARVRA